jgi:diketogulonate reductase-like aldo/keto reductase
MAPVGWRAPDVDTLVTQCVAPGGGGVFGVANFPIALLDEAIRLCPEPLVNLQAEYHPHLDQRKLTAACRERGLIFTAYCPLGRGRLLRDPMLADIAAHKGRPLAQIALRWLVQQGNIIPIPRSSIPSAWPRISTSSASR